MKVDELMVGDLVYYSYPNQFITKVIDVCSHGEDPFIRCQRDPKDNLYVPCKFEDFHVCILRPIPLTHEILEKLGFKERNPYFGNKEYISDFHVMLRSWNNGESFNFHFYESASGRDCWFPYPVQYVHELQHYFKDCNLKDIVL